MTKVLIAMDYHPTVQKVAETGFTFAKAMGAEVILVHIISDQIFNSSEIYDPIMGFTGYLDTGLIPSDIIDNLKKTSQLFLDKSKKHLGDDSIKTLIKEGDFADSILEAAKDEHADIIVMGSHSHKWLEKIMMGSVTEKVLRHTSVPVFIIPTKKGD
ncbi:MAG: universal stress protein [Bacteroidota bacterium]|nr:universal stress protein [Bacteroidota bacterium]